MIILFVLSGFRCHSRLYAVSRIHKSRKVLYFYIILSSRIFSLCSPPFDAFLQKCSLSRENFILADLYTYIYGIIMVSLSSAAAPRFGIIIIQHSARQLRVNRKMLYRNLFRLLVIVVKIIIIIKIFFLFQRLCILYTYLLFMYRCL